MGSASIAPEACHDAAATNAEAQQIHTLSRQLQATQAELSATQLSYQQARREMESLTTAVSEASQQLTLTKASAQALYEEVRCMLSA